MKLFLVFLLYSVSICPHLASFLLLLCDIGVFNPRSYDIVVALRQGVDAVDIEVEDVAELGEVGSSKGGSVSSSIL